MLNIISFFHAYKFTHFTKERVEKIRDGQKIPLSKKISMLLFGINNPRPQNGFMPERPFETVTIESDVKLEGWYLKTNELAKGTVVLFHGYGGVKSSYLKNAYHYLDLGYNALLVDFRGSGGSEGLETTIGYHEGDDVKAAFDFLQKKGEKNIILNGSSMGAAAILCAMNTHHLTPKALVLQCPFGTMYDAVSGRFRGLGVPSVPFAHFLMFWGGVQNGFWAFDHNPEEYAQSVQCPTLLMWGEKDDRVTKRETQAIFAHLKGQKVLKIFADAGHENYAFRFGDEWKQSVNQFLETTK
ncbi:MAG: alpha/beta hydrolase [Saprospiraceae bacterium]|nr:alpha/beta hydrolase [Saprospiraceae bacterium]